MSGYVHDPARWRAGRSILLGVVVILGIFGAGGFWSMAVEIDGAIVAPAALRVESRSKPVQHPEGGTVGEVLVREGDTVRAGDVLLRFDRISQDAGVAIIEEQLFELGIRRARLSAARDGDNAMTPDAALLERATRDEAAAEVLDDARRLFAARRASFDGQRAQLRERIRQIEQEIVAARSRRESFDTQFASVREELIVQKDLLERGLTTRRRASEFAREAARIKGEQGALDAEMSRLRRQIEETYLEITRLEDSRREDALAELREAQTRSAELTQRLLVARRDLVRADLRAPQDGVVQDMSVFAPGAVVAAGAPILTIVPVADRLVLEARVDPGKRDSIRQGQSARVLFSGFNQRTTPELEGAIVGISADRKTDEITGAPFYTVEVLLSDEERARLGPDIALVPGLPAEIFIRTGSRTPLSYLLKPLSDNLNRAMREE